MYATHLNGAKFCFPSGDNDETRAIGRGIIALVKSGYISLAFRMPLAVRTKARERTDLEVIVVKSHVKRRSSPCSLHAFWLVGKPSPYFQSGDGG